VYVDRVKNPAGGGSPVTRRDFLGTVAAASLVALLPKPRASRPPASQAAPAPTPGIVPPWWMRRGQRSRVVDVRAPGAVHGWVVDENLVDVALGMAVRALTGARKRKEAWQVVLGNARRIVLKFNSVGAEVLRTTEVMARLLVGQIRASGYANAAITLAEVPEDIFSELECRPVGSGWGTPIRVGGNEEPLANYLLEADAVVNVAFLKTHQIAGMSGCMKNISHAVIRHPARYHANACSPYVGQIVGSPPVANRLRLNLCNALRIVIRNGPEATEDDVTAYEGILAGFDPVAVDQVGLSILDAQRREQGTRPRLDVPYLSAAGRDGVGRAHPADIERVALEARG